MTLLSVLGYYIVLPMLGLLLTCHVLYFLSNSLQIPGIAYYARCFASFFALFLCAVYGTIASASLRVVGFGGLGQWTTARAFKWMMLLWTGVWMEIEDTGVGKEGYGNAGYLGKTRPAVFVGNHQTELDVLVIGHVFPKYTSVTAKSSLRKIPVLGWFMVLSKTVFVDRNDAKQSSGALGSAAQQMKTERQSVYMFAEGTRSYFDHPDLLPFKSGAFRLAVQAGVPVIPVVVEPYSHLLNSKRKIFKAGTIKIKVLKPIETRGMSNEPEAVRKFTDETRELMLRELKGMARANGQALAPQPSKQLNGTTSSSTGINLGVAGLEMRS